MKNNDIKLSSTRSIRTSLQAVYNGVAGLNARRQKLLARVPESNDWAAFELNSIRIRDIAYLSAATHHEFAILRGKTKDILFHGIRRHCNFSNELIELLKDRKLRLIAHTHMDVDRIVASPDDREFLRTIGQKESVIISSITGEEKVFYADMFEDLR